jgi:hypothetical protein
VSFCKDFVHKEIAVVYFCMICIYRGCILDYDYFLMK